MATDALIIAASKLTAFLSASVPLQYGMTPLLWAAYFGHIEIVEFLFGCKASLARKNKVSKRLSRSCDCPY